jgi:hypothetical protein
MSAGLPQRNDVLLLGLPLGKRSIGSAEAGEEDMRAVAAPQGRSAEVVGNDEMPVEIFDLCRLFDKYSCVQVSPHKLHSPRSNTEQESNETGKLNGSNPVTWVIDEPTYSARRTEEPFRRTSSETTQPANDSDLPRESEAA